MMFLNSPTGPKIKPSMSADAVFDAVHQMLVNVQEHGANISVNYRLHDGTVVALNFEGAPFKGKPLAQIDAALTWEVNQLAKRMGWD